MLKEIKCELKLFWVVTYLYVTFSLLYIGKKVYDNETREESFPFNIGYFVAILIFNLKSIKHLVSKLKTHEYHEAMSYFGWLFILLAITTVRTCTVGGYDSTDYQKIVDMTTLVSTLSYQFIVLYVVFIRVSRKIDVTVLKEKKDKMLNKDGSAVGHSGTSLV